MLRLGQALFYVTNVDFSSLEAFIKASSIKSTTVCISSSTKPRVVTAAVPTLIPEVTKGLLVSPGTVFLFTVIPAFPRAGSPGQMRRQPGRNLHANDDRSRRRTDRVTNIQGGRR